ncbi:MAG: hypothetical protein Kow0099_04820 [Candidatus Abyssubacteria bacterium]
MNEDYLDRLISDIQQYLKEEDKKKQARQRIVVAAREATQKKLRVNKPVAIGIMALAAACAVGAITVTIVLLGLMGPPSAHSTEVILLLSAAGCGIFFTVMLVLAWKRLMLLHQIERNTRLILANKRRTNALLDEFIRNMT